MWLDQTAGRSSFEAQLVEHRVYLMRFARLQLRNDAWAADAVSEMLLAALAKPQALGNRSQLKTWSENQGLTMCAAIGRWHSYFDDSDVNAFGRH